MIKINRKLLQTLLLLNVKNSVYQESLETILLKCWILMQQDYDLFNGSRVTKMPARIWIGNNSVSSKILTKKKKTVRNS